MKKYFSFFILLLIMIAGFIIRICQYLFTINLQTGYNLPNSAFLSYLLYAVCLLYIVFLGVSSFSNRNMNLRALGLNRLQFINSPIFVVQIALVFYFILGFYTMLTVKMPITPLYFTTLFSIICAIPFFIFLFELSFVRTSEFKPYWAIAAILFPCARLFFVFVNQINVIHQSETFYERFYICSLVLFSLSIAKLFSLKNIKQRYFNFAAWLTTFFGAFSALQKLILIFFIETRTNDFFLISLPLAVFDVFISIFALVLLYRLNFKNKHINK